jgi:hypothetical protein
MRLSAGRAWQLAIIPLTCSATSTFLSPAPTAAPTCFVHCWCRRSSGSWRLATAVRDEGNDLSIATCSQHGRFADVAGELPTILWQRWPCGLVEVTCTSLHGATTHKTAIFVLTALRTSNPTFLSAGGTGYVSAHKTPTSVVVFTLALNSSLGS